MENFNISKKNEINQIIPSNIEAEQHLLGSVLVNNDIIDEISNIINHEKIIYNFINIEFNLNSNT